MKHNLTILSTLLAKELDDSMAIITILVNKIPIYSTISNNYIYYETMIYPKGTYIIEIIGYSSKNKICSCPTLGSGYEYTRSLSVWINNIESKKKRIEIYDKLILTIQTNNIVHELKYGSNIFSNMVSYIS